MKYIIVLGDGMAGRALGELGMRTTLEAAGTPVMDALSKVSETGMASMVPEGMAPGSDTANLSVLGYDPRLYYSGRSPLEALSIGVDLKDTDVSFRCNLVTLSEEEGAYEDRVILDHSADEISSRDGAALLKALEEGLGKRSIRQGRICILSGNQLPASAGAKPRDRDGAYPSPRCPDPADRAVSSGGSFASKDDGEKL